MAGSVLFHPHPDVRKGQIHVAEPVVISAGCRIDCTGDVVIEKNCMIGAGSDIQTHDHYHAGTEPLIEVQKRLGVKYLNKRICEDVWIHSSKVLMGCTYIAKGVVIGAGSVVTAPITEEYSIWAGVPARRIGSRKDRTVEQEKAEYESLFVAQLGDFKDIYEVK